MYREIPDGGIVVRLPVCALFCDKMLNEPLNPPEFPPTRWSMVFSAAAGGSAARAALEDLCRLYWFPLYAFARQQGCGAEDAEDATQEFLAQITSSDLLSTAAPNRGRLRTYLLSAFQRDLIDAHRRATRQKRGGGIQFISIDAMEADTRYRHAAVVDAAVSTFDRAWAITCLETAALQLQAEYVARGQGAIFQAYRPFLDPTGNSDYAAAAQISGLVIEAARQAVARLRKRYRNHVRQTIADTLETPTESLIDEELGALQAALVS